MIRTSIMPLTTSHQIIPNAAQVDEILREARPVKLYLGDLDEDALNRGFIGLSSTKQDDRHVRCDITQHLPFPDGSVDFFQAEDVFEHLHFALLPDVLDDIIRTLKPGGVLRISVPDYLCDVLRNRSTLNSSGYVCFDPGGGGDRENPGHLWFPTYALMRDLLDLTKSKSCFSVEFLHYNCPNQGWILHSVDHSVAKVKRCPDFDPRVSSPKRPLSIILDITKHHHD